MCVHETPCRIRIYLIRVVFVQQTPCERPNANKHPCDRCNPCEKKIFVSFALLPPFGLWAFGESRVQKNIRVIRIITSLRSVGLRRISCSKKSRVQVPSERQSREQKSVRFVFKKIVFKPL